MESRGRAGLQPAGGGGGGWVLVEARLQGGAPWGFTVQGGLEHREPLIISKVEEGGKADSLKQPLLVGDEIIIINEVELSGYRQEAIALIKGSFKTLDLTVRRELDPGYVEEFTSPDSVAALLLPSPPPALCFQSPSLSPPPQRETQSSNQNRRCSAVQLRIRNRRSEQASRPHSWHSTKLSEGHLDLDQGMVDSVSSSWHQSYPSSASTTDLSGGFDPAGGYLRKSPDQYSSRGSMESLDPTQSSHHHPAVQEQHPLGHRSHSGSHPAYSSCQQLSSARSSNSIDHLHSKRDSAYSSFSTSSSIPEYLASAPSFSPERSYSLETVPQRGGGSAEMLQADMRYVRTVYDAQQGLSQEHELNSSRRSGPGRDPQGSVGGVCYRGANGSNASSGGGGVPASNRHSVGPIWGQAASHNSYESLKGAPAPPRRSDSYAAIRNHERPNSWSSLDHGRLLRSLQKGSWHHSSGQLAPAKGSYGAEGQLHTVMEKSPESSPTIKPRQGGGFSQPPSPTEPLPSSPPSRLILPASVYPVPQPEPQYAQIPSSGPGPSGVYVALPKESGRQQGVRSEGVRDEPASAAENGHQSITSSACSHSSYSGPSSSQLRSRVPEADSWHQQPESDSDAQRPYAKPTGGGSEGPTRPQKPSRNYGPLSQNFQESLLSQEDQQEQNHELRISPVHSVPDLRTLPCQERSDSRDKTRPRDQSGVHSEPPESSRVAQGQVPPTTGPGSAASQHQHWKHRDSDFEHPLTRLEIALAEVQRCASPNSHGSNGTNSPARSLSVLEKISHFERRKEGGKQRSHSSNSYSKALHIGMTEKGRSSPCGAEDIRNMLERSTKGTKTHRTMSYRGASNEFMRNRTPADPLSALQRSRSSFQLDGSKEGEVNKNSHWQQELQEVPDPLQDTSSSRSCKDSVRATQCTSSRQRDLSSSSGPQPFPVPARYNSLEKKGPKTKPKPQSIAITHHPQVTSPHTPKKRHVVSPDNGAQSPPPLPSVPPVGPPPLTRICGRKRLTADKKKRSYSEPENMNEVGVLDPETTALFRRGGETSVADRRKMFELAASHVGTGAVSRSDLRQVRQDALMEYVKRKRGVRREEGGHRSGPRPRSAFFQPEQGFHTDAYSLSSSSSLLSVQDIGQDQGILSEENSLCSTLTLGSDLRSLQSNLFYPGRVTTPRPPAQPIPGSHSSSSLDLHSQIIQDLKPEEGINNYSRSSRKDLHRGQERQNAEPQQKPGLSPKLNEALQRAGSGRRSGRSASAEDLLERLEKQHSPKHARSRSSPTTEKPDQNLFSGDVKMFGVSFSESGRCALAADRPVDIHASESLNPPQSSEHRDSDLQPAASSPDVSHPPVSRRERQRNTERLKAYSTSTLAASVGLPCPFSPAERQQEGGAAEWRAAERLSQANLDSISFPEVQPTSDGERGKNAAGGNGDRPTRHSLSDGRMLDEASRDGHRGRALSLDLIGSTAENSKPVSPVTSAPPPYTSGSPTPSHQVAHPHLSSLRISESSLLGYFEQQELQTSTGNLQGEFDEVFLQNPSPPPPPPLTPPFRDMDIMEDFPPPPPPPAEMEPEHQPLQSSDPEAVNISEPALRSLAQSPPPSKPQPSSSVGTSTDAEDVFVFEYDPLPKREKTAEELRVEALARQLVLQERSLAPLLDTWGGESTMKLMEEIFSNSSPTAGAQEEQKGGSSRSERIQPDIFDADQRGETDVDEETDLNTRKVELCEALRINLEALQREKKALCEEQRGHRALGANVEALIQEQLKTNEKEKYSIYIGDLERIVNLLLSLCSRLSRVDGALLSLERDELMTEDAAEERDSLHHKRSLLLRQTEDARELKENLDRRQRVVNAILSGYLTETQLQDYRRFVSAKPSLLIRQRHLDDLIRRREEQLSRLTESLPAELTEAGGRTPSSALCPSTPSPAHSVRSTAVTSL
ncbi:protein Shroom3 isoform X1 [Cyprinodon tularosa]|uniref:protein Shroom3 isoform X1 n=1 Tax=Cyprinodon tularosa TaxID=77115 RepID=UPI0018E2321B|nr:protein Shroom3 isoform X1 [Cyprinodon tularosa]